MRRVICSPITSLVRCRKATSATAGRDGLCDEAIGPVSPFLNDVRRLDVTGFFGVRDQTVFGDHPQILLHQPAFGESNWKRAPKNRHRKTGGWREVKPWRAFRGGSAW